MTGGIVDLEGDGGAGVCVCVCEFSSSFNFRCTFWMCCPSIRLHTQKSTTKSHSVKSHSVKCAHGHWTVDTVKLGICGLINVANNGSRSLDAQTAF